MVWSDRRMIRIPAELLLLAIAANRSKQICIFITMSGVTCFPDLFLFIYTFSSFSITNFSTWTASFKRNISLLFLYARKCIKFTIHILFTLFLSRFISCEFLSMLSQVTVHFFPLRNIRCDIIIVCSFIFFFFLFEKEE